MSTLTDGEIDAIEQYESFDRCRDTLRDLCAQARSASRLRAGLKEALLEWSAWETMHPESMLPLAKDDRLKRIAELRKLVEGK
jgi:hypothetical protein